MREINNKRLKVFLCHSKDDKLFVRNLYEWLLSIGCDPWLDEAKLLPGQIWEEEIRKAVKESHIVIICMSKGAVDKRGYVQKEIRLALNAADEIPENDIYIIPLKIEPCNPPESLGKYQWTEIYSDGYSKLLLSLITQANKYKTVIPNGQNITEQNPSVNISTLSNVGIFTAALNQQIGKVLLLIKLKNSMSFAELCPLKVAFGIWTYMPQKKIKSNFFIESPSASPRDRRAVSYSNYRIEDDGRLTGGHIRGTPQTELEFFTVELDFPPNIGQLKEFHDEKLFVLMTDDMLERTSFIELIVDGWVILHKDIIKSHWRKDRGVSVEWPKFKYKEVEFYRNWNDDSGIGYSGWRIDLYNQIPFRYSLGVSRWSGF